MIVYFYRNNCGVRSFNEKSWIFSFLCNLTRKVNVLQTTTHTFSGCIKGIVHSLFFIKNLPVVRYCFAFFVQEDPVFNIWLKLPEIQLCLCTMNEFCYEWTKGAYQLVLLSTKQKTVMGVERYILAELHWINMN